jgi:hypothetical protein
MPINHYWMVVLIILISKSIADKTCIEPQMTMSWAGITCDNPTVVAEAGSGCLVSMTQVDPCGSLQGVNVMWENNFYDCCQCFMCMENGRQTSDWEPNLSGFDANGNALICCDSSCFFGETLVTTDKFSPTHLHCRKNTLIKFQSGNHLVASPIHILTVNGRQLNVARVKVGDMIKTLNGFDRVKGLSKIVEREINIHTSKVFYVNGVEFQPMKQELNDWILPAGTYNISSFVKSNSVRILSKINAFNNAVPEGMIRRDISCWDELK